MLVVVLEVLSMTTLASLATTSRGTPGSDASNFLSYQNTRTDRYFTLVPFSALYMLQYSQALTGQSSLRDFAVQSYTNLCRA